MPYGRYWYHNAPEVPTGLMAWWLGISFALWGPSIATKKMVDYPGVIKTMVGSVSGLGHVAPVLYGALHCRTG